MGELKCLLSFAHDNAVNALPRTHRLLCISCCCSNAANEQLMQAWDCCSLKPQIQGGASAHQKLKAHDDTQVEQHFRGQSASGGAHLHTRLQLLPGRCLQGGSTSRLQPATMLYMSHQGPLSSLCLDCICMLHRGPHM